MELVLVIEMQRFFCRLLKSFPLHFQERTNFKIMLCLMTALVRPVSIENQGIVSFYFQLNRPMYYLLLGLFLRFHYQTFYTFDDLLQLTNWLIPRHMSFIMIALSDFLPVSRQWLFHEFQSVEVRMHPSLHLLIVQLIDSHLHSFYYLWAAIISMFLLFSSSQYVSFQPILKRLFLVFLLLYLGSFVRPARFRLHRLHHLQSRHFVRPL